MPFVEWSVTLLSVCAQRATLEIRFLNASQNNLTQYPKSAQRHVSLPHVERMLSAENKMELAHVHVYQNTLETRMKGVGRNVSSTLTAQPIRRA